jgi:hypothetical protein
MRYLDTGRFDAMAIRREHARERNVVPIRPTVAQVNEDTAGKLLRALPDGELDAHIGTLQAEHTLKRAALRAAANALARALNEKLRRSGRG